MKSTGMIRPVDNLGRVVLPKELRVNLKLEHNTPLEIFVEGEKIILQKHQPDTWNVDELRKALVLAAQDAGKSPEHYLPIKEGREKP